MKPLDILISNAADQPIYDQICTQIKSKILSGELAEGEALPSIRSLARELRISVITTKRAYDELEQEGFVCTVAGKGCYVAEKNLELIREDSLKKIEEHMEQIRSLAAGCGLSGDELVAMFRVLTEEGQG